MCKTVCHNNIIIENSSVSSPSVCPLSLKGVIAVYVDTCVFFWLGLYIAQVVSNLWTQSIFSPCVRITCGHHRVQFLYFFQINTYFSFYTNGTIHHTLFCLFYKNFYWNNSLYIEKKFLFEFALCLWWWNCRSLPFIFLLLLLSLNFSFMY